MANKKVAVSVRKRSQAREDEAPPDDLTQVMAMSDAVPTDVVARSVAAQPDASSVAAQPVQPATIEEFVSGVAAALEQSASELRPSEVKDLLRRTPEGYR